MKEGGGGEVLASSGCVVHTELHHSQHDSMRALSAHLLLHRPEDTGAPQGKREHTHASFFIGKRHFRCQLLKCLSTLCQRDTFCLWGVYSLGISLESTYITATFLIYMLFWIQFKSNAADTSHFETRQVPPLVSMDLQSYILFEVNAWPTCSAVRSLGSWLNLSFRRGVRYSANGFDKATILSHRRDCDSCIPRDKACKQW